MVAPTSPNTVFASTPLIGVGLNRRTNPLTETNPVEHTPGMTVVDQKNGKVWLYVSTNGVILSNATVTINWKAGGSVVATSVLAKTSPFAVNGTAPFAAGDYGWVQTVRRLGETNYKP